MTKALMLLSLAVAAALTPAALSFASTQTPAITPVTPAVEAKATPVQVEAAAAAPQACKPAVRIAYAGYGEASRSCAAAPESAVLPLPPGKPAQR